MRAPWDDDPAELLDALARSLNHAFFVIGHGNRPVLASEAFCDLIGYSHEEFIDLRSTRQLVPEADLVTGMRMLNGALAGEPQQRRGRLVRRDGSTFDADIRVQLLPLKFASSALVLAELWPDGDMSRRPTSDDRVGAPPAHPSAWEPPVDAGDLLDALLATIGHACLAVGQYRRVFVSEAFCDLLGYSATEFMALDSIAITLGVPGQEPEIRRHIQDALGGAPGRLERRNLVRADGETASMDVLLSQLQRRSGVPLILAELWPDSSAECGTAAA